MRNIPKQPVSPSVTIRVSGSLFQGHISYLDELVASAIHCGLWPLLNMSDLQELDGTALKYLVSGEGRHFGIVSCPSLIREWMQIERERCAA